jgi:iron complex transport system ATP-binding protein
VIALHDLNLAATFCDRILVLNVGRLITSGPPRQALTPDLLAQVYRVIADITPHPRTGSPQLAFHPETGTFPRHRL